MAVVTSAGVHQLIDLDATTYQPHPLHRGDRIWSETNCYTDVWIEVVHALGAEPLAMGAFSLSTDFEGTQWSFFKPPPEDLRALYGMEVAEMNVWRPLLDHVAEELDMGRLLTIEVDAWYLPDTAGTSYRTEHVKTTIVPQLVDREGQRLGYFHAGGYYELTGEDFDGLWAPSLLPPYVELIRLDDLRRQPSPDVVSALTAAHLARRPPTNPVRRMAARIMSMTDWLAREDGTTFHLFAFGTCRQCGANAELAASYLDWLALPEPAAHFRSLAEGAKALQFGLARLSRGRTVDVAPTLDTMADDWDHAMALLCARYGG